MINQRKQNFTTQNSFKPTRKWEVEIYLRNLISVRDFLSCLCFSRSSEDCVLPLLIFYSLYTPRKILWRSIKEWNSCRDISFCFKPSCLNVLLVLVLYDFLINLLYILKGSVQIILLSQNFPIFNKYFLSCLCMSKWVSHNPLHMWQKFMHNWTWPGECTIL